MAVKLGASHHGNNRKDTGKEVRVEAADLSQMAIQDRKVVSVRVVRVALFINFE